jgi:NAD(P)-dependent dehydrogenase (short-subunit alcohol dehydrogenase family)
MPGNLEGKRALVTGGSAGLGKHFVSSKRTFRTSILTRQSGAAIAVLLAQKGAKVAVNYVHNEQRARDSLTKLAGSGHIVVQGDASERSTVTRIVKETVAALGGLDIVVSNAGWTVFGDFNDLRESRSISINQLTCSAMSSAEFHVPRLGHGL